MTYREAAQRLKDLMKGNSCEEKKHALMFARRVMLRADARQMRAYGVAHRRPGRCRMAIKNYTSTMDACESLGRIQGALAKSGVSKIMVDCDGAGQPIGITFLIETAEGSRGFILPANMAGRGDR